MAEIRCPIASHAESSPQAPAVIAFDTTYCYQELDYAISHLVCQLKSQGVTSESRVAYIACVSLPTLLLPFALFRLKAIACPLSFRIPHSQIPGLLNQLSATHFLDLAQLQIRTSFAPPSEKRLDCQQLATCLLTSGSSGTPKIACHTLKNHYASALCAIPQLKLVEHSRSLLSLPLFHVSGISTLFRAFLSKSSIVLSSAPLAHALIHSKITHASLVPTQLFRCLQDPHFQPQYPLSLLIGGAPLSSALYTEGRLRGLCLFCTYGMTEMSSMITLASPEETDLNLHVGKPLAHCDVKLDKDEEIYVRGETLFAGYWDASQQALNLPLKEGWFATSDLGEIDRSGNWIWKGRKDRLFISGGENIQPEEIERALCSIAGILSAHVRPQADPEFGNRPIAYILEKTPHHTLESIKSALKEILPSFMHPISVLPFTEQMREGIKSPLKNQG